MPELRTRLTDRLEVLRRETELGEERLRALEDEATTLRRTLLRIDGATQVLREVLAQEGPPEDDDVVPTDAVARSAEGA
jgi:hypothetical protein